MLSRFLELLRTQNSNKPFKENSKEKVNVKTEITTKTITKAIAPTDTND